ncbi:MAG: CHAT domain-containing protein [bacterium]
MDVLSIVTTWADEVGLTLQYQTLRPLLLGGIHTGYQASLQAFARPLDQLWSDVQSLSRQGPLADGKAPFRIWLANVVAWAERTGQSIAGLAELLAAQGLAEPPPSEPSPAAPAAGIAVPGDGGHVDVLFLSANPDKDKLLNLDREQNEIQAITEATLERHRFRLAAWPDIKLSQLAPRLMRLKPQVLHFSGHGGKQGDLLLRGENGEPRSVAAAALADILEVVGGSLRLVILNACYSDVLSQAIVDRLDVAVVGMTRAVSDTTALQYSRALYQGLFDGLTPHDAHRVAAANVSGRPDETAPALRVRDGSQVAKRLLWV